MSAGRPKQSLEEGFNKFVVKNKDGCWDWTGAISSGYGQFRTNMKRERSHRASWIIHNGLIPPDKWVLHRCDNRKCSKPEHLFLGTCKDNNLDMIKKGYHPTLGKKGENNHRAILTNDKVRKIRGLLENNKHPKLIAPIFNISKHVIWDIKNNKSWKGVA